MSLSNTQVISLLNQHFVPVFLSNEDYAERGAAPAEEKAELRRVLREGRIAGLSVGTVHAYILTPDGHTIDSLHTAQAAKVDRLVDLLQRTVHRLGTPAGSPVVQPAPPAVPAAPAGTLRLHLTARYLEREGETYRLTGQEEGSSGWASLPSEDWILLDRAQWTKLLPAVPARAGQRWEIDTALAAELLRHFYPPTENWDLATNRTDAMALTATVASMERSVARVRLEGRLTMKHPFYHKDDPNFVEASVVGFVDVETKTRQVRSLRIVTDEAVYRRPGASDLQFGVAVTNREGRH